MDPLHVPSDDRGPSIQRLVPVMTELDGGVRMDRRGAHRDGVMEGKAELLIPQSVVLDQALDRVGDSGSFSSYVEEDRDRRLLPRSPAACDR